MNAVVEKAPASVGELVSLHDEDFVRAAYWSVLGRAADPGGLATYLQQVRLGREKADIVRILALSTEGRMRDPRNLAGLPELLNAPAEGVPPPLWSRVLLGLMVHAMRPLVARLEASEHHLLTFDRVTQQRLERIEQSLARLAAGVSAEGSTSGDERNLLEGLSLSARGIYSDLRKAAHRASSSTP